MPLTLRGLLAPVSLALVLASCAGASDTADGDAQVDVGTGVYAFEWLAEEIGGDRVSVTNIAPRGADAHSLELSPAQVVQLEQADLIVHLPQYQAAMDDAVAQIGGDAVLDAALSTTPVAPEELHARDRDGHEHHGHEHDDDAPEDHAGHDHGPLDPHVWLDPERMVELAHAVTEHLTQIDPDGAGTYAANRDVVVGELDSLHDQIHGELADCAVTTVVVGHQAFGYLLAPHGFTEAGLAGPDGGTEVSPARIAELSALVVDTGVTTIYRDANAPDDAVRAVAEQTGTEVADLDPIELPPADGDYLDAMRANIEALASGQRCG